MLRKINIGLLNNKHICYFNQEISLSLLYRMIKVLLLKHKAMRKILLLITIILLTISCNHKPKEQIESPETKTLTAAEKRNQEIQDSLKQLKIDSLALIAWGDVNFGITMKEALATETFKGGYKYSYNIVMEFNRKWEFQKSFGLNHLALIRADFQKNELTSITIESNVLTANYIDNLTRDCDIFIRNFTKKYGEPSFKKEQVNITDFNS